MPPLVKVGNKLNKPEKITFYLQWIEKNLNGETVFFSVFTIIREFLYNRKFFNFLRRPAVFWVHVHHVFPLDFPAVDFCCFAPKKHLLHLKKALPCRL